MVNFVQVPKEQEKVAGVDPTVEHLIAVLKRNAIEGNAKVGVPSWKDIGKMAAEHPCKHLLCASALRADNDRLEHENRMLRERLEDLAKLVLEKGW